VFFPFIQTCKNTSDQCYVVIREFNICLLCDMPSTAVICSVCQQDMLWHSDEQVQSEILEQLWVHPRLSHLKCDTLICLDKYRYPLTYLIPLIKFHDRADLSIWLADRWYEQRFALVNTLPDALISVPLHPKRLRHRGFNQAALIADRLSTLSSIPHLAHAAKRRKATKRQSELQQAHREANLTDAFTVDHHALIGLKHIALVDDVVTTGATMNALCQAIQKVAPHLYIDVWCLGLAEL